LKIPQLIVPPIAGRALGKGGESITRSTRLRDFLILAADLLDDRVFPVCDSHEVTLLRVLTGRGGTSYFPPLVRLRAFRRVCRRRTLMRSSRPIHMVMLYNEDLSRCELFDFILAQAVEPIK
jgi:hypothetical protein